MNAWVAEETQSLITDVVSQGAIHPDTILVLATAIYFKGKLVIPFDDKYTEEKKFHLLDGSSHVTVPFMRGFWMQNISCHDGFKMLPLRYTDNDYYQNYDVPQFSMCIFLPTQRDGLPELVNKIASDVEGFLLRHLKPSSQNKYVPVGQFFVPKFKLSSAGSVAGVLKEVGLQLPFDMVEEVDDGVEEEKKMLVEGVIHKAVVEVSDVAAVTMTNNERMISAPRDKRVPPPRNPMDFVADHPFAFFVVEERSCAVVLAGQVLDPSKE
uniref:Serpin domain-containing protein n=1 Tax=Leersia perrieri TaxID=77586 RepID=A0A0D9XQJ2_9ORYZ